MQRVALVGLCGLMACSEPRVDTQIFALKHLRGEEALEIIRPYGSDQGTISMRDQIITVRETPDNLEKIAAVLASYDRPAPGIRLRFQVIQANGASTADPAIAEVEAALRNLFRFRGYRLIAEAMAAGMEGGEIRQVVAGVGGPYRLGADIQDVMGAGDSVSVRVRVSLEASGPTSLLTTVTLRAGQTAVLGNTQMRDALGTLILTVRPEVMQ